MIMEELYAMLLWMRMMMIWAMIEGSHVTMAIMHCAYGRTHHDHYEMIMVVPLIMMMMDSRHWYHLIVIDNQQCLIASDVNEMVIVSVDALNHVMMVVMT